jgi:hypothetical protein
VHMRASAHPKAIKIQREKLKIQSVPSYPVLRYSQKIAETTKTGRINHFIVRTILITLHQLWIPFKTSQLLVTFQP